MSASLAGIRIVDLADRSAALAGRILADLGAEVMLVEPPSGNSIRRHAPFVDDTPGAEHSFAHLYLNANKRSVVLDLDAAADRERFVDLVATADVVIDSEPPGRLDGLGLGHSDLRDARPGLIQASVTPYGLHSPWRDRIATDLTAGASGGLVWLSGERRSKPLHGGANPSYTMAGLIGASAITIALTAARRKGHDWPGTHIDISLQEATAMAVMQTATPGHRVWQGRIPRRPGLSNALKCADGGYVGLLVRPDRFGQFLAWCDQVGIDHGMTEADWEWARLSAPRANNPVAEATLALAAVLPRDDFAAGALEADLVCLPVLDFADMSTHEQYLVNDQFSSVRHGPLDRDLGFVRSPVDAMADGVAIKRAPTLGEDQELLDAVPARQQHTPTGANRTVADPARALEGIRVVDFGWVLAAPIGTRLLASFGAEVIRVESSKKPDSMRSQLGPADEPDPNLGGLFNSVNAGKKSLTVDLTTAEGLALVKELIATADVVVNNFRPGSLDRMGLGYDVLRELKHDIVLLNLPGAHRKGPWAVRSSMGNILMAASGFNMLMGFPGERPRGVGVAYPDFTSPHLLTATVLAALRARDDSGQGQQLHLSQLSGMVSLLGVEWMQYATTGIQPSRSQNRDPNYCPHGVYPALGSEHSDDEWVALAVATDEQFQSLCELMGQPDLARDRRFATHHARKQNEDDLDAVVAAWTARDEKWRVATRCQQRGIAAAAVQHLADMLEHDPQMRDHYQMVHQPIAPDIDIPIVREAAQWAGADHRLNRSPLMGEHNEYVVREILGRSEEDYIALLVNDVLG